MSNCFEKARELGELIKSSEQAMILTDASARFHDDLSAQQKMGDYKDYQTIVQESIERAEMSESQLETAAKRLEAMSSELKKDPVIGSLIRAENEFNALIGQVISIVRLTAAGEQADVAGCSGCGGRCARGVMH